MMALTRSPPSACPSGWPQTRVRSRLGRTRLARLKTHADRGRCRAGRPRGTVAVVGRDVIRRTSLDTHDDAGPSAIGLIELAARYALVHDFDVLRHNSHARIAANQ